MPGQNALKHFGQKARVFCRGKIFLQRRLVFETKFESDFKQLHFLCVMARFQVSRTSH
jgi:hypothetical protein